MHQLSSGVRPVKKQPLLQMQQGLFSKNKKGHNQRLWLLLPIIQLTILFWGGMAASGEKGVLQLKHSSALSAFAPFSI
ncbi:hypothetical protein [Pontibacter brevis]